MNFDELVQMKALQLKQHFTSGCSTDMVDHLTRDASSDDLVKAKLRNICALVSDDLFTQVEGLCSLLSMSKRQFVEMSLINAVSKAEDIIETVAPFPSEV